MYKKFFVVCSVIILIVMASLRESFPGTESVRVVNVKKIIVDGKIGKDLGEWRTPLWHPVGTMMAYCDGTGSKIVGLDGSVKYSLPRFWINCFSPDGAEVLGTGDGDKVLVMNIDGSNRRVISGNLKAHEADWSPDKSKVAIKASPPQFVASLYVGNSDGTDMQKVLDRARVVSLYPKWSPDGKSITVWTDEKQKGKVLKVFRGIQIVGADDIPIWSPDSRSLFGTSDKLSKIELGGKPFVLAPDVDGSSGFDIDFNHGVIIYSQQETVGQEGYRLDLWIMNLDGSGKTKLTSTEKVDEINPKFSPDGKYVAYIGGPFGGGTATEIYLMELGY